MQSTNQNYIQLVLLLDFYGNNKAQLSSSLGVHYQTVVGWERRKQVGRHGAVLIDQRADIPFSKEQLRPDLFKKSLASKLIV